jgi:hypothetical protein
MQGAYMCLLLPAEPWWYLSGSDMIMSKLAAAYLHMQQPCYQLLNEAVPLFIDGCAKLRSHHTQ